MPIKIAEQERESFPVTPLSHQAGHIVFEYFFELFIPSRCINHWSSPNIRTMASSSGESTVTERISEDE